MARNSIERRLREVGERIKRQRAELAIAAEQVAFCQAEADEARLRDLVSETPIAAAEARDAQRHADALRANHDDLARSITALQSEQDSLLDRMAAELR